MRKLIARFFLLGCFVITLAYARSSQAAEYCTQLYNTEKLHCAQDRSACIANGGTNPDCLSQYQACVAQAQWDYDYCKGVSQPPGCDPTVSFCGTGCDPSVNDCSCDNNPNGSDPCQTSTISKRKKQIVFLRKIIYREIPKQTAKRTINPDPDTTANIVFNLN